MSGSEITGKVQMKWDEIHRATEQHAFPRAIGLGLLRGMKKTYYFISPVDF